MDDKQAYERLNADRREQLLRAIITGYLASYANPAATGLPSNYKIVKDVTALTDDLLAALDNSDV